VICTWAESAPIGWVTAADAELEKEWNEEGPVQRFISAPDYAERMKRAAAAEQEARQRKAGLWSDAEVRRWNPPTDAQMIEEYRQHKSQFARVAALVRADERSTSVNWSAKSRAAARKSGVPQKTLDEYVHILKQLGVNRELTNVDGIGVACLITADIVYGLFDTGVIKGYVLSAVDLHPLAEDLDHWPADVGANIVYRRIDNEWSMFEFQH
jgi:hypothetical protein